MVDLVSCRRDIDAVRLAGLSVFLLPGVTAGWCSAITPIAIALLLSVVSGCRGGNDGEFAETPPAQPARRIIALAPHLTELVFTAGAGDHLVGVVEYSDFPDEATKLPRVGDAFRLDYEAIAALEPDLVIGWQTGTPTSVITRLRGLGYRVVALDSRRLDNIAENLRTLGRLAGTAVQADAAAAEYEQALIQLRDSYRDVEDISVFYQISARPMLTISRHHLIGEAIDNCGGQNIFAELDELTPAISVEAVLDRSPEVIMASNYSHDDKEEPDDLSVWTGWPNIPAVHNGDLYFVSADEITRPSTRILEGVAAVCRNLDSARNKKQSTVDQARLE